METIFYIVVVLFSVIIHEISHGLVAEEFGDDTAKEAGRLTLNPIPHIDPWMTIMVPLLFILSGSSVIFGSAKPVPINVNNMTRPRLGMALSALAGPMSNLLIAVLLVLPVTFGLFNDVVSGYILKAVTINLVLATLNLIPIPPLDGSKILAAVLPTSWMNKFLQIGYVGFILVFIGLYTGVLTPIFGIAVFLFETIFKVSLIA